MRGLSYVGYRRSVLNQCPHCVGVVQFQRGLGHFPRLIQRESAGRVHALRKRTFMSLERQISSSIRAWQVESKLLGQVLHR